MKHYFENVIELKRDTIPKGDYEKIDVGYSKQNSKLKTKKRTQLFKITVI